MPRVQSKNDADKALILNLLDTIQSHENDPVAIRLANNINAMWENGDDSAEYWDVVLAKYKHAFKMPDTQMAKLFAGVSDEGVSAEVIAAAAAIEQGRPNFTSLITNGWFADYMEYTKVSESPPQFHFGSALAWLAAGFGRRPLIGWEARPTYPNMYILLVGPTGSRKGSAISTAQRIIGRNFTTHVLPSEGTHQGFAEALRQREEEAGQADGLILAPEFRTLLSKDDSKRDMVTWLTDWWDSPDTWERALRGERGYVINNMCVSILGASTMTWLREVPRDAIQSGFFPRYVIFDSPENVKRWGDAMPKYNFKLEEKLGNALLKVCRPGIIPDLMTFDKTSERWLETWYKGVHRQQYESVDDDNFRSWLDRKQAQIMKIATIWQIVDRGPKDHIASEWLEKARIICNWVDGTVEKVYGGLGVTFEGELPERILSIMKKTGGQIGEKTIIRKLRNAYRADRIRGAFKTLHSSGEVKSQVNKAEGHMWFLR